MLPDHTLIPSEASNLLRIAFIFAFVTEIVVFFESEQNRQCLPITTLRRVRVTITVVKKQ
jgi:hypothetical protein